MVFVYSGPSAANQINTSRSHFERFWTWPEEAREDLGRIIHVRRCHRGESLIDEGGDSLVVGGVLSGVLRHQKMLPGGRCQIVGLRQVGDLFGRITPGPSLIAVEAATESRVWVADRGAFENVATRHPQIQRLFLADAIQQLDDAREWMVLLGGLSVNERLARFFVMQAIRQDGAADGLIQLPVNRKDIAGYLSTTVESLSRFAQEMTRRKILHFVAPRTVLVENWSALFDLAGVDADADQFQLACGPREREASMTTWNARAQGFAQGREMVTH